jgi:hypothetical protein
MKNCDNTVQYKTRNYFLASANKVRKQAREEAILKRECAIMSLTVGDCPGGELGIVPMTKTSFLNKLIYAVAVALALFSGGVSTYGLTKFAPSAELVIVIMGLLFEAGKLVAFSLLHKRMPLALKGALLTVGLVLISLNIVGVSGFLSNAYERAQTVARAVTHTAEAEAAAEVATLERQLKAAEEGMTKAREALARAKGDRDQIRAVNTMIAAATAERDGIATKLAAAHGKRARAEGSAIAATAEFAAIAFLSAATGTGQNEVAHLVILGIASLPDILAVLLLLAAGITQPVTAAATVQPAEAPAAMALTPKQIAYYKGLETQVKKLKQRERARNSAPKLVRKN